MPESCRHLFPRGSQMKSLPGRFLCVAAFFLGTTSAFAGGPDLNFERGRMKNILHMVSNDIEKNFYDASMKGLDWKAQVNDAEGKIDKAQSPGEMITAIFALVNKLNDSHTMFLPPGRVSKPKFGFNAKPFGKEVMIYEITKKGAAEKAGLQ